MAAHQQQRGRTGGSKSRPWRLCLVRQYTDGNGEKKSTFLAIGSLFRNEKGFSADSDGLFVDLQRGDRLALFPPDDTDG